MGKTSNPAMRNQVRRARWNREVPAGEATVTINNKKAGTNPAFW
jgi:hypothetical protein